MNCPDCGQSHTSTICPGRTVAHPVAHASWIFGLPAPMPNSWLMGWICPVCGEANSPYRESCTRGPHSTIELKQEYRSDGTFVNVPVETQVTEPKEE